MLSKLLCATSCLLFLSASVWAATPEIDWPTKGGPSRNGHVPPTASGDLPVHWNEQTGQNIAWKKPLDGEGHSTPVIGQGRIWFTSANPEGTRQYLDCVDERSGKLLRHQLLFENAEPEPLGNKVNTYASPTCVLEADALYVHFGTYGTARIEPATGDVVWQRRDIKCHHFRGPGSSPVVFENLLILTFDCIDKQFLIALDKASGETVWRTKRSTDYGDLDEDGKPRANGDYRKAFGTPAIVPVGNSRQLISVGSRAAFGYDPRTGEEIWTITHEDFNAAGWPLYFDGHVIINTGSGRADMICVRLDETTRGNVDDTHVVWHRTRGNSDLSNPILANGRLYMISNNGVLFCLDPLTGDEIFKDRIGGTFVASPIVANGRLYCANEEGVTTVVKASDHYEVVAENQLKEGMRASPAASQGALFLRTFHALYKIETD